MNLGGMPIWLQNKIPCNSITNWNRKVCWYTTRSEDLQTM